MKKSYLDVLRIAAIVLVLMNHQPAYKLYYSETGVCEILALIEAVLIRINVPLFAMVSGTLLLGREESLSQLWHKRITRILLVILIFSTPLYLELGWLRDRSINVSEFIYGLTSASLKNLDSYWFLYAYLGYLLMMPFLRKIAKAMTSSEFIWLMVIHIVMVTLIPTTNFILQLCHCDLIKISSSLSLTLFTAPLLFYPLIGYYVDNHINIDDITRHQWMIMGLVCLTGIALTCTVVYTEGHTSHFTQNYLDLFKYINTIAAFLCIKKVFGSCFTKKHPKASKALSFAASLVFGIYLLDLAVQLPVYEQMWKGIIPIVGKFGFSLIWCVCSFVLGGTITYILKHLPFFRKLL